MKTFSQLAEGITKPVPTENIRKVVNRMRKSFVGKELTPSQMSRIMERELGKEYDLDVEFETHPDVDVGSVIIRGFYNWSNDEDGDTPIEIQLLLNPKTKKLPISREAWPHFATKIVDVLQHELMHQSQFRNRGFKKQRIFTKFQVHADLVGQTKAMIGNLEDQFELGSDDEIDPHAKNISNDLLAVTGNDKNAALKLLRNPSKITVDHSVKFKAYFDTFRSPNHKVIQKLVRKTILFINNSK